MQNITNSLRDRTKRLFQFIRELILLRQSPIRTLRSYEQVIPLYDLPSKPDCSFIARSDFNDAEQETWLEVRCPHFESYPAPPSVLTDWLDPSQLADASVEMPTLQYGSHIPHEGGPIDEEESGNDTPKEKSEQADIDDPTPQIKEAWERYIENQWWPWAERTRPRFLAKKLYDELFRIYQKQEHLGETYEVVIGFGLLSWRPTGAIEIQRHLVTVTLSLELDSHRQILTLNPTAAGIELRLEEDMLEQYQRPRTALRDRIKEQLKEFDSTLWLSQHLHDVLKEYCNSLASDAQYDQSDTPPKSIGTSPVVTFAPALILRKRGSEGMIGLIDEIIPNIENGGDIPISVLQQVDIIQDESINASSIGEQPIEDDDEIYFPLPANREQRRIIEHLNRSSGIVVEGPPGTGKSQTIANLVCHLLATGKRVLVTSHTARALQVLREKIPELIRPLCVQALSNDSKGMDALEYSVKGITDRHHNWNQEGVKSTIERLIRELCDARERLQLAVHDQRSIREAEVFIHECVFNRYTGSLAKIARQLKNEQEEFGFISEKIHIEVPPCSVLQFRQMISVLNNNFESKSEVRFEPPDIVDLVTPEYFDQTLTELAKVEYIVSRVEQFQYRYIVDRLINVNPQTRQTLIADIETYLSAIKTIRKQRTEIWLEGALKDVLSERERNWSGRLSELNLRLSNLRVLSKEAIDAYVTGLNENNPDEYSQDITILREYLEKRKGKNIGFRSFLSTKVKTALRKIQNVRINGAPCERLTEVYILSQKCEANRNLAYLDKEWINICTVPAGTLRSRINEYEEYRERLLEIFELSLKTHKLVEILKRECSDSGPTWHDEIDVQLFASAFSYTDALLVLEQRKQEWAQVSNSLKRAISTISERYAVIIARSIKEKDGSAYRSVYNELVDLRKKWERTLLAEQTLLDISKAAPSIAQAISHEPNASKWELLAERWEIAWAWASTRTWLEEMVAPGAEQRAAERVAQEQENIQERLAKLASEKAWAWCFSRLTEQQRQSLHAWSNAVKRIGRTGKGKYANLHRSAARRHIADCQPAIPAWIMPLYRVAESIRPQKERFDVAIIDEASQSGPEALSLLFLANKIVVVGDEKQISPDPFTRVEDVERLRREYISDLPSSDALVPENSLFDLAKIRYPARIRLVEHFRCMPEIIQFSNELCYRAEPLLPLRQYGAGRLEPVVQSVHVRQGYLRGERQKLNPPEAVAIARKIAELIKEDSYNGKSFGVISLLGDRQARQIETELLSLVNAKEINKRMLICGDAYDFQGDERDVMFLSLVVAPAPGKRISALSDPKGRDQRRYNVAMSRAKDQVWLFHSATINDLNPNDLRFKLLSYCQNPRRKKEEVGGINIQELAHKIRNANRSIDKPPGVFDSWFEVDVFMKIATRGYLVIPQYEVIGYFIDLAIVGQKGKMAVECDGEHWHGAEQWEKDYARQRDLERCQWPFFRIRESTFYMDPEASLELLWEELRRQGIFPQGEHPESEVSSDDDTPDSSKKSDATTDSESGDKTNSTDGAEASLIQDSSLPKYVEWEPHPIPNPRSSFRENIIEALMEIVKVEGPVTWRRVFDRYRIGLELGRMKGPTREALEACAKIAVRSGKIIEWAEFDSDNWYDLIIRIPMTPIACLRQRGPRNLEDVPPSEIVEVIKLYDLEDADKDWAFRQILSTYGLRRLTVFTRDHLSRAFKMLHNEEEK